MNLNSPLTAITGVGDAQAQKFAILGLKTVGDLINYYPRRYDDFSQLTAIAELRPGAVSLEGEIKQVTGRYVRRGMHITEAIVSDNSGSTRIVWFNQPYRAASIKAGKKYFVSGQFELSRQRFVLMNPSIELSSDMPVNAARILAVYRETKGLTSRQIRQAVAKVITVIDEIPESLPLNIVKHQKLISRSEAIKQIHLPVDADLLESSRRRLGFEEVFELSLASLLNKQENAQEVAESIVFDKSLAQDFVAKLPFKLTDAQRKTVWQIYQDLQLGRPMNRLVEGDVGSGKTVVATMAALMVMRQGWQVAFMAPTELLARQHGDTIRNLLKPFGLESSALLLVGSMSKTQKDLAHKAIAEGKASFIIGTHALIQEKVDMHKLAFIVIDEQHRFGVEQRKTLMAKAGHMPHVLSMTATPIPRSLALTIYGELDISILDEKPAGRQDTLTELISPNSTEQVYDKIKLALDDGRQMFTVCPLISESGAIEARSAEAVYEEFTKKTFKNFKIGLLHGKLKPEDKQSIMADFVAGKLDILVSTTVIEVGVDVPNATIMMVESPERFGLAQLHQLRGRVGRGEHRGQCFLMLSDSAAPSRRLRALESSNDGFKLAELDLDLRGPGAIYGTSQHGLLDLRIAKLSDSKLIAAARAEAQLFIDNKQDLLQYKQLATSVNRLRAVTNLN